MVHILRGHALLGEKAARLAIGTLRTLFKDNIPFGINLNRIKDDIGHAIRFHLHHQLQPVGRHALEVGGVVLACERVVAPSVGRDRIGQFPRGQFVGRFEQKVLKEMRDTRFADRFVCGPGAVPDHMHNHRRAVVLQHDNVHAIVQLVGGHISSRGGQRQRQPSSKGHERSKHASSGVSSLQKMPSYRLQSTPV